MCTRQKPAKRLDARSRWRLATGIVMIVALACTVGAPSAGAVVARFAGHGYGVTPRSSADQAALVASYRRSSGSTRAGARARAFDEPPFGGLPLENLGEGPVMHKVTTHVIFWDPAPSQFTATTKGIVEGFFTALAHDSGLPTNAFAVAGQYTDATGNAAYKSTFGGASVDTHAYPSTGNCVVPKEVDAGPPYATCLFDSQLQAELSTAIAEKGLPTGLGQLYFVLLPHDVATCLAEKVEGKQVCSNNFYCAYHSYSGPGTGHEVIYADIPFSLLDTTWAKGCQADGNSTLQLPNGDRGTADGETRFADVALKFLSHEYIEAVTDPLVNFETAWVDEEGLEIGDKCNGVPFSEEEEGLPGFDKHAFTPTLGGEATAGTLFNQEIDKAHYYLQSEWDNAAEACRMKPLGLSGASFSVSSATAGSPVAFHASASDPYGAFEPTWTFGDGSTAVGANPVHSYAAAGEYEVRMTPEDALTGSTAAPVSHRVTVAAPLAKFPLSVEKAGAGEGEVASAPAGIECGSKCSAEFAAGTEVTLTPRPAAGSTFAGWFGACTGTGSCRVTVAEALAVEAEFAPLPGGSGGGGSGGGGGGGVFTSPGTTTAKITTIPPPPGSKGIPDSGFASATAAVNAKTDAITLTTSVLDPGTLSFRATFPNGKFGAFTSNACKRGQIKLGRRCLPATVVYSKGARSVSGAGTLTVTLKPTPSALKALRRALKQRRSITVTVVMTFQSSLGGPPVTHSRTVSVKPRK
jgi:PKD repeat protein